MITITATVTIRENDTPLVTVEHVEGRAAWDIKTLVYSFPDDSREEAVKRALLFARWALDDGSGRYQDSDAALALRNLANALSEYPAALRRGNELAFAAGLFPSE